MPCCSDREKGPVSQEEKWDYVVSILRMDVYYATMANQCLESGRFQVGILPHTLLLLLALLFPCHFTRCLWC